MNAPLEWPLRRARAHRRRPPLAPPFRRKILFEALEPRLLFSADLAYTAAIGAAIDAKLTVDDIDGAAILRLIDNQSSAVLGEQLVDQDIEVNVFGGDTSDRLAIAFDGAALAHPIHVNFDGGGGSDTLVVADGSANTWIISGRDAGTVDGRIFAGVENLTGGADNEDVFVLESAGSLSGLMDGGAGGFDSLAIKGGTYSRMIFTYSGPNSGTVDLDGKLISYDGLEPVLVDVDPDVGDVEFNVTAGADQAVLEDAPAAGSSRFRSLNGTFETTTFVNPAASLTINLLGGNDLLTIGALDAAFGANLVVNAGDGSDDITITTKTGAGTYTINGQGAAADTDTIRASRVANMALTNGQLTVGGDVFALSGVERAVLIGASIDSTAFTGQVLSACALPDWISQGPGPLNGGLLTGIPNQPTTGAVQTIAVHPDDLQKVYIGTVGGGVWRSSDRTVLFNSASADPTAIAGNTAILNEFAAFLFAHPTLAVDVAGYTDADGLAGDNLALSNDRATAVRQYLIDQGIDGARLTVRPFGETRPIALNDPLTERQPLNRRVELLVNHWEPLTDAFPSLSISAIAIDPSNSRTIYAATGVTSSASVLYPNRVVSLGLLKSTDGGATWDILGSNLFQGSIVHDIEVSSAGVILVATDGVGTAGAGLFRSTDGGNNFTNIATATAGTATPFPVAAVTDIVVDPLDATRFYVGVPSQGVYTSINSGANWNRVNLALPAAARFGAPHSIRLAISAANDAGNRPVYAATLSPIRDTLAVGVAGGGVTNTIQVAPLQLALGASIFEAGDTIVIGAGLTSETFTVNSTAVVGANIQLTLNGTVQNAHLGGTVLSNPGRFRLLDISRSNDLGATWAQMNLPGTNEAGAGFAGIHPGGQADTHFSMVADPFNANRIYVAGDRQAGTGAGGMGLPNSISSPRFHGRLFTGVFAPGGGAWQHVTDTGTADPDGAGPLPGTAPHADSREMIFQGIHLLESDDGGIYRLTNPDQANRSWESINDDLALTELFDVAYDTVNNLVLGGAQDNGVGLQSATGSSTWNSIALGDGGFVEAGGSRTFFSSQNFSGFGPAFPLVNAITAAAVAAGVNTLLVPL